MPISPQAIERFLQTDSPIYKVKGVDPAALKTKLGGFAPIRSHYFHQLEGMAYAVHMKRSALFFDPRLGKTQIALDWAEYLKSRSLWHGVGIIVVPRPIVLTVWEDEANEFSRLRVRAARSIPQMLEAATDNSCDLVAVSWSGFQHMFSHKVKAKQGKKFVNKLVPNYTLIDAAAEIFSLAIIDELHYASNPSSLRFKIVNRMIQNCDWRLGLTGSPTGRDPFDVWAQIFLLDEGKTLGTNYHFFTEAFGKRKKNPFSPSGFETVFDERKLPYLQRKLASVSLSYKMEECRQLPEINANVVNIPMLEEQQKLYKEAIDKIINHYMDTIEINSVFVRLRQISSGFLPFIDNAGTERCLEFPSAKLEWLEQFLESIGSDKRIVIVHTFTASGERICKLLTSLDIKHTWLYGGSKDQAAVLRSFQQHRTPVLVANAATGDVAIDLQLADYFIFYESPVPARQRKQVEDRAKGPARNGRPLFIDDLCCSGVERRILRFAKEGRDLMNDLIHNPQWLAESD